ncbi:MAG TPA: RNA polymerase sigma factor region1.1 domain-containing protein, partial [Labilithrix sp.]
MANKNRNGQNGNSGKEVQQLIENGKQKGFLTYDEVNEQMPAEGNLVADQMDDVMGALGDEDIEIVDAA